MSCHGSRTGVRQDLPFYDMIRGLLPSKTNPLATWNLPFWKTDVVDGWMVFNPNRSWERLFIHFLSFISLSVLLKWPIVVANLKSKSNERSGFKWLSADGLLCFCQSKTWWCSEEKDRVASEKNIMGESLSIKVETYGQKKWTTAVVQPFVNLKSNTMKNTLQRYEKRKFLQMFCEQNVWLKCYLTYLCHNEGCSCIILLDLYKSGHQIPNRLNPNGPTTYLDYPISMTCPSNASKMFPGNIRLTSRCNPIWWLMCVKKTRWAVVFLAKAMASATDWCEWWGLSKRRALTTRVVMPSR